MIRLAWVRLKVARGRDGQRDTTSELDDDGRQSRNCIGSPEIPSYAAPPFRMSVALG
jgi:hypothetical protein